MFLKTQYYFTKISHPLELKYIDLKIKFNKTYLNFHFLIIFAIFSRNVIDWGHRCATTLNIWIVTF